MINVCDRCGPVNETPADVIQSASANISTGPAMPFRSYDPSDSNEYTPPSNRSVIVREYRDLTRLGDRLDAGG